MKFKTVKELEQVASKLQFLECYIMAITINIEFDAHTRSK